MIFKRFIAMGYKYDEAASDLLIAYQYFGEGTQLVTMKQGNLRSWVENNPSRKEENVYQPQREINMNLFKSILINIDNNGWMLGSYGVLVFD